MPDDTNDAQIFFILPLNVPKSNFFKFEIKSLLFFKKIVFCQKNFFKTKIFYKIKYFFGDELNDQDLFGWSIAHLGDLDGDNVNDLAVGAAYDDDGGTNNISGAVYILFLNANDTVKAYQKISASAGGLNDLLFDKEGFYGMLDANCNFGTAIANIGDFNGDNVPDIVVGSIGNDDGGNRRGAIYILFLNTNGTVYDYEKISSSSGLFSATLEYGDTFGMSIASLGDLDGDNIVDIAVGTPGDDDEGINVGALYIIFLDSDGRVKSYKKITENQSGFTATLQDDDNFGYSVANIGDINNDGIIDLAVGAIYDDDKKNCQ